MSDVIDDESGTEPLDEESIDFAVAAYREEGAWVVASLPARAVTTLEGLRAAIRQLPGEGGVFGIVAVEEEFFVLVRTTPRGLRALVSDGGALLDWPFAQDAIDEIGLEWDDDDLEDFEPVGDLAICADFGLDSDEMLMICSDPDMFPEDQVRAIAKRLGCGRELTGALRIR